MSDTLELHAKFINAAALSLQEHPMPAWSTARNSARSLLAQAFRADGHEIIHGMLALAAIAFEEKKRHQKAKKAKGDVPPPVPVDLSHLPVIRKELWARTYDAALPADVAGAAILMNSIAPFAHIDKLDRHEVWTASIRGINVGLENTRHSFATALELISLQSNEALIRSLWRQEGVAKSAIILLLSPVEEIHDPVISLVQHSFEDVDDRGDCFHVLLKNHPDVAIEGLTEFLQTFIETARITPDSCGLA